MRDLEEINSRHPLLAHRAEDALWDRIERNNQSDHQDFTTVRHLLEEKPHEVLRFLKKSGVKLLGEFTLPVS